MLHSKSIARKSKFGRLNWYALLKSVVLLFVLVVTHFSLFATETQANKNQNPVLVCNDQVNISIPNGTLTITAPMVANLMPNTVASEYELNIIVNGLPQGNQVSCVESGELLAYSLEHIPTSISCWGTILIEDKTGPFLECSDVSIACSANSSIDSIGIPIISDNCDENPSLIHIDNFIDYNCTNNNFLSTIERTWIATDNLGNSSSCVQNINITRPSIHGLSFPDDITISCTDGDIDPSNTGGPSVAQMLSGSACNFVVYFEDTETSICTGTSKIIRRWFVTDWCTGNEIEDTQIIEIVDNVGPILTCPDTLTFSANESTCDATINLPILEATDECSNVISVIPSWEFGSGHVTYENIPLGQYLVIYTAEDDCGNTSRCPSVVNIDDDIAPVAICDLTTTVSIGSDPYTQICADDLDSGSYDNCELVSKAIRQLGDTTYSECITLSCAEVGQTLAIELQVIDVNGLENHCTVAIEVLDKIPPVITSCASDITISCDDNINDLTITGSTIVEDNCTADINFSDESSLNECNVGEIIRTFVATDGSGNSVSCQQRITVEDNTAPVIQFSEDITLVCVDNNDELAKPTVEDNCGVFAFSFEDFFKENTECIQVFTRTWEVLNLCTDEKVSQKVEITLLNDLTLPQFSDVPTDITASCDVSPVPDFIDPIISDVCDNDVTVETFTTDEAGSCPETRILTRTYLATDDCGNSNSFTQTIRLIDTQGPSFVNFPLDQTINCDENIMEEIPSIFDNCDPNPTITFTDVATEGDCTDEILLARTFTATDACGNVTEAIQQFRFVDNVPPIIRGQTEDFTQSCAFPIPSFDLGAIDNCDDDLDIEVIDNSVEGDCPNEEVVTRFFIVTDDCGNEIRDTIVISLVDNQAPIIIPDNLVENLTINCNQAFPVINFTLIDNCDNDIEIVETISSTGDACDMTVIRTFTATDDCGNANSVTQNLRIIDDRAPIFASFPQGQDVTIFSGESVQVDVIDATIMDNCSDDNDVNFEIDFFSDGDQPEMPNIFVNGNNASGVYPLGSHTITFNSSDACGNTLTQDLLISVVDFSPSALCNSVSIEIGENGLLLVEPSAVLENPNLINVDSIESIRFVNPSNFTQVIGESILLDCQDLGLNQFAIETISVNGTSSICSNMINLIDTANSCGLRPNEVAVAGKVLNLEGIPMKNVEINLTLSETEVHHTDQYGVYSFGEIPQGTSCTVQPVYDQDHAKGVSTFDMVLIMRHILQIQDLTTPYQHLAADVDLNGRIDISDLLEIRSLILFQRDRFTSPSYTFIEKDYEFINPENPLAEDVPSVHVCSALSENMIDLDFYMIKMGDIDGAIHNSFNSETTERSHETLFLQYDEKLLKANEESEIYIKATSVTDLAALQFTLHMEHVELINLEIPNELRGNYFEKNNNIHFAWTKFDQALPTDMVRLVIKPFADIYTIKVISLASITPSVHFSNSGSATPIQLQSVEQIDPQSPIILEQNNPNPFKDYTDIKFYLTQKGNAILSIHDLTGKLVHKVENNFEQGWNQIRYTPSQFSPGIYIYSVQQGQQKQTKKMVITK